MTNQAHEILILEGTKTTTTSCPQLPKNEPRIKQSPSTTLNSSCWRGYVGTWEIKQGRLFLIGLSGNYRLLDGPSIFAQWFSGELVVPEGDFLHNFDAYEREQHITVINGIVVSASMKNNLQARAIYFSERIEKFVRNRGITSLLHFTKVANVPGILEHGLLGRHTIASSGLKAEFNDQHRYDNAADSVCASISFPNYKMFYSLQQNNGVEDWAVLRLSPSVLWEIPCAYCFSNAASSEITRIPIESRMEPKSLESMFEDIPPKTIRAKLGIPNEYTTDPQAEVLILGAVDPKYILNINVNAASKIKNVQFMSKIFRPYAERFQFSHDESLFTYRKDYGHWKDIQQLPDDDDFDLPPF